MKKIIHLLSSNSTSGAEKVAINIIENFGSEFEFIYMSPDGIIRESLHRKNITYISIKKMNIYNVNLLINKLNPDIIHSHDFKASILSVLTFYPCKKVSHIHQNPLWMKKINMYSIIYFISSFFYDNIIAVSNEIFQNFIFQKNIKSEIVTISNFIDKKEVLKLSAEANFKKYDLLFIGRLSNEKNPLQFIKIVEEVKKENKNISAVIVGEGKLEIECKELILRLGLEDNIKMLGFLNNPFPIVNSCKIVCITSIWEGFGLAAVESVVLGKLVLTSKVGGLKDIFSDTKEVFCGSTEDFSKKIIIFLKDEKLYSDIVIKNQKNVLKYINKKNWSKKIRKIYNEN